MPIPLEEVRERYAAALLETRWDQPASTHAILNAELQRGIDPRLLIRHVLAPALVHVGACWSDGRISVAQEHLATLAAREDLRLVARHLRREPPVRRRAVVASTQDELHDLGGRMLADCLEGDGWDVLYVGASVPTDALVQLVRDRAPDVVALSTALSSHLAAAHTAVAQLKALPEPPLLIVGGAAYDTGGEAARRVGADVFAHDAIDGADLLRARFTAGVSGGADQRAPSVDHSAAIASRSAPNAATSSGSW